MSYTRYPAVAGMFYPDESKLLTQMVQDFCAAPQIKIPKDQRLRAIVAPHAGYVYSGPVAGEAYRQLETLDPEVHWKVILLGPAHRVPLRGISVCAFDDYETPLGRIQVSPLAQDMAQRWGFIPEADLQEHSLEVQLPFLQRQLKSFEIIPIVIGAAPPQQLAELLMPYLDDQTLLVVSTDLSHYFPYDKAVRTDKIANQAIPNLDIATMKSKGDACGLVGVLTVMYMARAQGWQGHFLAYQNSGDTAGPKDRVVGYGAYAFSNAAA